MAWLCPRNSISNVVASLTIHDERNIHFNETIVEGRANRSLYLGLGGERQIEHWIVKVGSQQARVNGESNHDNVISAQWL